ncbi:MAG: hypothetical protein CEE38_15395 [Planctomycetes bacterium B3_Pla]|nr:MAG: hypothetical protein CEE38_15395 [Planctomycetes bacterium B3_Pla]
MSTTGKKTIQMSFPMLSMVKVNRIATIVKTRRWKLWGYSDIPKATDMQLSPKTYFEFFFLSDVKADKHQLFAGVAAAL